MRMTSAKNVDVGICRTENILKSFLDLTSSFRYIAHVTKFDLAIYVVSE